MLHKVPIVASAVVALAVTGAEAAEAKKKNFNADIQKNIMAMKMAHSKALAESRQKSAGAGLRALLKKTNTNVKAADKAKAPVSPVWVASVD